MTIEEKNFLYIAERVFITAGEEAYIGILEDRYLVHTYYLKRRSIYEVKKSMVKEPRDIYLEVSKQINLTQFQKEDDGLYNILYRPIIIRHHNKEFKIGVLVENPDDTIYIKLKNDLYDLYAEYPFLNTIKDDIHFELNLVFDKYKEGQINLIKEVKINKYLYLGDTALESFSEKERINEVLLLKI